MFTVSGPNHPIGRRHQPHRLVHGAGPADSELVAQREVFEARAAAGNARTTLLENLQQIDHLTALGRQANTAVDTGNFVDRDSLIEEFGCFFMMDPLPAQSVTPQWAKGARPDWLL